MSEKTVVCNKCGERVPKKKFCYECAAPLALSVNQPTTNQEDKASTPVQVSDSVSLEVSKTANDVVNKQPTSSSTAVSRHTDSPGEISNGTPSSYAEAAAVGSYPSDKGSQQNDQAERVPNNGPAGSSDVIWNVNVTKSYSNNDVTAATYVAGGANKKVVMHRWAELGV